MDLHLFKHFPELKNRQHHLLSQLEESDEVVVEGDH